MTQKKHIIFILIGLLILAILCVISFIFNPNKVGANPEGTIGNTAGNLYNQGLFCESDGYIYFANAYDQNCMYRMDIEETTCEKLTYSATRQILAGQNHLYYAQTPADSANTNPLYSSANGFVRMSKKGTNPTRFHNKYIFHMQLVDNTLYYLSSTESGPEFYSIGTNHEDQILLSNSSINPSCVSNGIIYYNDISNTHNLMALNTYTGSTNEITTLDMWFPIIENNYIYHLDVQNNYRLARYDRNTETVEYLTEDRVDCYNISNGYIYYQKNSTTEPALKRMRIDGSEVVEIASGNYTNINVTSTYVYFYDFMDANVMYRIPAGGGSTSVQPFTFAQTSIAID